MNENKKDIFDRIISWKVFRPVQPFYQRYKEQLLYLFFGALTTLVNIVVYWSLTTPLGMAPLLANVIAWVVAVAFAYVTNRTWVFDQKAGEPKGILREAASFAAGRLATLGLEELILWLGIDVLGVHDLLVKIVAQVLVIVGNYVISKWFVFRKA